MSVDQTRNNFIMYRIFKIGTFACNPMRTYSPQIRRRCIKSGFNYSKRYVNVTLGTLAYEKRNNIFIGVLVFFIRFVRGESVRERYFRVMCVIIRSPCSFAHCIVKHHVNYLCYRSICNVLAVVQFAFT